MEITGPHGANQTYDSWEVLDSPISHPVIFICLDLLRSTWLTSDVQQTLISSVPWYVCGFHCAMVQM